MKKLKIVAIGAGNVATQLVPHFFKKGHTILQVYSRNITHASPLAKKSKAEAIDQFDHVVADADVYYLMVSDDAIEPLAKELSKSIDKSSVILHCSGSKSSKILKGASMHYGVLYPLQTFTKEAKVNLAKVPVFTTGNSKHARELATQLGMDISKSTYPLSDKKRTELHLAAVVCNNFVHHLFVKSSDYLKSKRIPFEYLLPLIENTTKNAAHTDIKKNQTGPAKRKDNKTIKTHLEMLQSDPDFKKLYAALSKSIKATHT